ncbi:hypothetical protein Tco_1454376 [Tanacetum coccineum]
MEHGFLSQQGSGGGRGVTEKDLNRNKKNTFSGIGVTTESDDTMSDDNPIGVASAIQEGVTPSVVDMTVEIDTQNSLEDTTVPESFPTLTTLKVNVRTLFTPGGNGIDVVVLLVSIRVVNAKFANTAYGFFLGKKVAYSVVANYVRNTWGKYGLKEDVSTVPVWDKFHGVPVMAFSEDGLSVIATKLDGSDKGYGTNSFLEQWRDSYPDNDDYDPYDDDMYENHDLSEHLQSICDDLDITVRDRKKK